MSPELELPAPERRGLAGLSLAGHVGIAALTGLLFGLVDAAAQARPNAAGARLILAGAAAASLAGALVGLIQAPVTRGLVWLAGRLGAGAWFERHTTRDPDAPREPVIRLHAGVLASAASASALIFGLYLLLKRLETVTDPKLMRRLTMVAVGGGLFVAAALGVILAILLAPLFRRVDRRVRLPWPGSPGLRYALYVALPLTAALWDTMQRYGQVLGLMALPLWLVLFVAAEGLVARLLRRPWLRMRRSSRLFGPALAAAWIALIVAAQLAVDSRTAAADLQQGRVLSVVLPALRGLTDVDRDGAAALFGGKDCAPFSGGIHPAARDVPGNGVDEDCSGADADPAAALASAGPRFHDGLGRAQVRRYNVVWVVIDALRADHTSVLGYSRRTTPYLERLAGESLLFSHAYSQSSMTLLSMSSMQIGRDPARMQWVVENERPQASPEHPTIVRKLSEAGYRTGMVGSPYFKSKGPGLIRDYKHVAVAEYDQKDSGARSAALALSFLEEDPAVPASSTPFFLMLYLPAPHHPYVAHAEGYPEFGGGQLGLYDQEIAAADRYAGFVIDYLRQMPPLWDNTIVIVTGDHGEEFGEHGGSKHAQTCYRESVHVPLIVRVPGVEPRRVDAPVALTDVVPTLIELIGLPRPSDDQLDGHSLLLSALTPERLSPDRPISCAVFTKTPTQGRTIRQSVRIGGHMLTRDLAGPKGEELYDTRADAGERRPLPEGEETAAIRERLRTALGAGLSGNLGTLNLEAE